MNTNAYVFCGHPAKASSYMRPMANEIHLVLSSRVLKRDQDIKEQILKYFKGWRPIDYQNTGGIFVWVPITNRIYEVKCNETHLIEVA